MNGSLRIPLHTRQRRQRRRKILTAVGIAALLLIGFLIWFCNRKCTVYFRFANGTEQTVQVTWNRNLTRQELRNGLGTPVAVEDWYRTDRDGTLIGVSNRPLDKGEAAKAFDFTAPIRNDTYLKEIPKKEEPKPETTAQTTTTTTGSTDTTESVADTTETAATTHSHHTTTTTDTTAESTTAGTTVSSAATTAKTTVTTAKTTVKTTAKSTTTTAGPTKSSKSSKATTTTTTTPSSSSTAAEETTEG